MQDFWNRFRKIGAVKRQSIILLFWQLALSVLGYVKVMYFSHVVGASVMGAYFLFIAYYSIISVVSDGGFGKAAVKRISEGEEQNAYFSAYVFLRIVFIMSAVLVLFLLKNFFHNLNESGLFILLPIFLIAALIQGTVGMGVAGQGKMGIYATCGSIGNVSTVFLQVIAINLGYGAFGLALGAIGGVLIGGILEFFFLGLRLVHFSFHHLKNLFGIAFWLFLSSGGILIFSYTDTILIGYFMDNASVGIYKIVFQLSTVAAFITGVLGSVLWPRINKWWKENEKELIEKSLSQAFSYSLALAIPICVGGILLGDKILQYLYGHEFVTGYAAFVVLLGVQIINVFQSFFILYLDALYFLKQSFKITALAALLNVILNIVLIPRFGIVGGAFSILLSMCLITLLAWNILSKEIIIKIEWKKIWHIILATLSMGIAVGVMRLLIPSVHAWELFVQISIGGAVFIIVMLKLDKNMWIDLREMLVSMKIVQATGVEDI